VKKGVGVQILTIFVYSNSIVATTISMNEGFVAFLFFYKYHPPINIFDAFHENYIFNKWKKYDVSYNGNLSTSFATSSIL
jgi:hypothetical protein